MRVEPLQVAATCNECGQIIPAGMRARIYERRDGSLLVFHADRAICKAQAQAGRYQARPKAQVGASRQAGTYQAPQAQAQFLQILAYKAEEAGRRVIKVDPKYTSQDCPVCGHREKKPLWVRAYTCPQCGTLLHRDVAAAQNILAKAWTGPSGETLRAFPQGNTLGSPGLKSGESSPVALGEYFNYPASERFREAAYREAQKVLLG